MSLELVAASSAITLALVFYTIGVFSERRAGFLKKSHVILCFGVAWFSIPRERPS